MKRKLLGYEDVEGHEIRHGDIIQFYYRQGTPPRYSSKPKDGYKGMVEICFLDHDNQAYSVNCNGWGAKLEKNNNHSTIIGNVYENRGLLEHFLEESIDELFPEIKNEAKNGR